MAKYKFFSFLWEDVKPTQFFGDNIPYYLSITFDPKTGISTLTKGHEGVDFPTPNGTNLYGPFTDGIVVKVVLNDQKYGNYVVIWDPLQLCAIGFAHLKDILVKVGDHLKQGIIFAHTNNTGNTSGPHVHVNGMETDKEGYRLNKDNGWLGYVNLLDPELFEQLEMPQKLTVQTQAVPLENGQATKTITIPLAIPETDNPEDYMGVKKIEFTNMRVKCDTFDPIVSAGYVNLAAIDTKVNQLQEDKDEQKKTYEKKIDELNLSNLEYQKEAKEAKDDLAKTYADSQAILKKDSATMESGINAQAQVNELQKNQRDIASFANAKPEITDIISKVDGFVRENEYLRKLLCRMQTEINTRPSLGPVKDLEQKTGFPNILKWFGLVSTILLFAGSYYYAIVLWR